MSAMSQIMDRYRLAELAEQKLYYEQNFLPGLADIILPQPPLQTSVCTGPTIIALGHGDITCEHRIPYSENVSFVYPDESGSYATLDDALNFIRVYNQLSSNNVCDLRTIVNVANQNNDGRQNKLKVGARDYYETTCSNVFNFKSKNYDWVCLSGIHNVDATIIARMRDSFSFLRRFRDKSYISRVQVLKMYNGAIYPHMNDTTMNQLFIDKPDDILFDDFKNRMRGMPITFTNLVIMLRTRFNIGIHLNLVFANCRVICQDGKIFASTESKTYPYITHNPELVSLARTRSPVHEVHEEGEDEGIRVNRDGYEWYNTLSRKTYPVIFNLSFDKKFLHMVGGLVEIIFNNQDGFYYYTLDQRVNSINAPIGYGGYGIKKRKSIKKENITKRKHNKKKQRSKKNK
jgi:hypothetical protein